MSFMVNFCIAVNGYLFTYAKVEMNKRDKFQFGNVLIVSLAHLLHDIYSSFLAPVLPMLIDKFGMSLSAAGFLSVAGRLPSLLNPVIGLVADRVKIRYFIIFSPLVTSVVMSLLGLAPNYTALVIMLFVMGISSACFHVPGPVMARRVAGDRVGKAMSWYMIGGELARSLGPLVILGAVYLWGLGGTYWLIPFGVTASAILFGRLHNIEISQEFHHTKGKSSPSAALRQAAPTLMLLMGIAFFRGLMKASLTTFLPTYLYVESGGFWRGGIYLAIVQLAGVAGVFVMGPISDHIGRKKSLMISALATPVLMWIFCIYGNALSIPILLLTGFFLFAPSPILLAVVQDLRSKRPAFINGIYMTISFIVGASTILLVGILGDHIGLEQTYKLSAFLALGAIPFIFFIPGKKDTPKSQTVIFE